MPASQDPWSIRFGRWLAGIEPTVIGWETNSGFRLGIAGNGYLTTRFSELVVSRAAGEPRRLTGGRLFVDGVYVSLLGRGADQYYPD